jgi:hypothetical protein
LRGYEVYHAIHPSNCARGGSAVIIKTGILHHEDVRIVTEEFQVTAVKLKTTFCVLTVVALYSPPRHNMKRGDYLNLLQHFIGKFIIGGDFNSKNTYFGSRLTNSKRTALYQAIKDCHCEVHTTGKPTYWPTHVNKIPDMLDFFVSKHLSSGYIDVTEKFDLDSDHSPILLTLSETIIKKPCNPSLTKNHIDWDKFRKTLTDKINLHAVLTTIDELEGDVWKFVTDIQH